MSFHAHAALYWDISEPNIEKRREACAKVKPDEGNARRLKTAEVNDTSKPKKEKCKPHICSALFSRTSTLKYSQRKEAAGRNMLVAGPSDIEPHAAAEC